MYLPQEHKIWLATGETPIYLEPAMANRHGLIAGATGTGKTITMKVMAESFSDMGVPVFLADVKGDLSGMCRPGQDSEDMRQRVERFGIEGFTYQKYPTRFWDIFGENGIPVRVTVSSMGPTLLARLLGCAGVVLFAQPLAGLFSLSATTHAMCVDCMRIVSLGFLFAGLCIAFQGVFQALECGVESLVISLCRQVLFVLPPVWALTCLVTGPENVALVWWPLALGEAATLVVALVLYGKRARKRMEF